MPETVTDADDRARELLQRVAAPAPSIDGPAPEVRAAAQTLLRWRLGVELYAQQAEVASP
jgi:hypothetical protein